MSTEEEIALQEQMLDPTIWALILKAEGAHNAARDVPYWGIIPFERLSDPIGTKFYVRARVSSSMTADVEVTKDRGGFSVGPVRIAGREEGQYRLTIHSALAVLPHRAVCLIA